MSPKMVPRRPKMHPRGPHERPKSTPRVPKRIPRVPKSVRKAPKIDPRATKMRPGNAQGAIRGTFLCISSFFLVFLLLFAFSCTFLCEFFFCFDFFCDFARFCTFLCILGGLHLILYFFAAFFVAEQLRVELLGESALGWKMFWERIGVPMQGREGVNHSPGTGDWKFVCVLYTP